MSKAMLSDIAFVAIILMVAVAFGYLIVNVKQESQQRRQRVEQLTRQCEERGGVYLEEEHVCFRGERILLDGEK